MLFGQLFFQKNFESGFKVQSKHSRLREKSCLSFFFVSNQTKSILIRFKIFFVLYFLYQNNFLSKRVIQFSSIWKTKSGWIFFLFPDVLPFSISLINFLNLIFFLSWFFVSMTSQHWSSVVSWLCWLMLTWYLYLLLVYLGGPDAIRTLQMLFNYQIWFNFSFISAFFQFFLFKGNGKS